MRQRQLVKPESARAYRDVPERFARMVRAYRRLVRPSLSDKLRTFLSDRLRTRR
jgi:hypothetical protein